MLPRNTISLLVPLAAMLFQISAVWQESRAALQIISVLLIILTTYQLWSALSSLEDQRMMCVFNRYADRHAAEGYRLQNSQADSSATVKAPSTPPKSLHASIQKVS